MIKTICSDIDKYHRIGTEGEEPPFGSITELLYRDLHAMLQIEQTWVTSKHKEEIYRARRPGPMRTYCKERYGWTHDVFNIVSWDSMGRVHRKLTLTKRM